GGSAGSGSGRSSLGGWAWWPGGFSPEAPPRARAYASMPVCGGVDPLGEFFEPRLASLQLLLGPDGRGSSEDVAELDVAEPTAEPFEALLLFVQFRKRELPLGNLPFELGLVLGAFADELRPLVFATRGEQRLETAGLSLVAAVRVQQQCVAAAALDQSHSTIQPMLERRRGRKGPYALTERERTCAAQLAPDRNPVTRRRSRQPHRQHSPAWTVFATWRHNCDCSSRYAKLVSDTSKGVR